MTPITERFWSNTIPEPNTGCWLWLKGINNTGYGVFCPQGPARVLAHRFAWEATHGPVPHGLLVLHRCDNPPCCNPTHLFLGTHQDNADDKVRKGRQHRPTHFGPQNGALNFASKLTWEQVRGIRAALARGERKSALAKQAGVHPSTITLIASGRRWREA